MQGTSRNNLDERALGPNTATFPGHGSKEKGSFPTRNDVDNESPDPLNLANRAPLTGDAANPITQTDNPTANG